MAHDVTNTLNVLAKQVYGDMSTLYPDFTYLQKKIGFRKGDKSLGLEYVEAVKLSRSQGFTYGSGLVTLGGSIVSAQGQAKIKGNPMYLQEDITFDVASRLASGGAQSFIAGSKLMTENMMESFSHRLEAQLLYGSVGLGTLDAGAAVVSGNNINIVLTAASWATGIWAGQEQAQIQPVNSGNTAIIQANSNDITLSIVSISPSTYTINCDVVVAGAQTGTTVVAALASGQRLYFKGAFGNESVGIDTVCSTTSASTLYGLSSAAYSMWQASQKAIGGALTVKKLYKAVGQPMGKGLLDNVSCLVNPDVFLDMVSAELDVGSSGGRRYTSSSDAKNVKTGGSSLVISGPQGEIEVVPHAMVKTADGFVFPIDKAERIGSTDITFKIPGRGDEMFIQSPTKNSYELRLMSDQAFFMPCPAKCLKLTGIAPSA
jgi:hypothetical protein